MKLLRFGAVGIINTLIDFGVLNLLLLVAGTQSSAVLAGSNAAAFMAANLNSYLMNRQWTFCDRQRPRLSQYLWFLAYSVIGLVINSAILLWLSSCLGRGDTIAVNVAKAGATAVSMSWNYLSYRFWVFRRFEVEQPLREEMEFF